MAREGIPYIVAPLLLALLAFALGYWPMGLLLLALSGFMAFFFRDPEREIPRDENIIVAPADGRVTRISPISPGEEESSMVVSIFLSPLDVHINRAPISGTITDMSYKEGRFLMATNEKASLVNEQNILTIQSESLTIVCKQIAGILARRIVCWKHVGDRVELGERFGLIKFSSRTDLILPPSVRVEVREGMRVRGGITIIGRVV
ncbi:MAG: phosphatidylserine decarboxylase [Acidobacteria bacterium 13_1_20CM_3_53_8]|nr:MAG: phosphatidylserine decarboxylase [Acidobacteria bacterium 13_1_20CM_3_53_8]